MTEPNDDTAAAPAPRRRATIAQRTRAQRGEWGQYRATTDVRTTNGALAFAAGHPVPASHVDDEGRVVLARHQCDGDPDCGGDPDARCDRFNEPIEWSEPGSVREG